MPPVVLNCRDTTNHRRSGDSVELQKRLCRLWRYYRWYFGKLYLLSHQEGFFSGIFRSGHARSIVGTRIRTYRMSVRRLLLRQGDGCVVRNYIPHLKICTKRCEVNPNADYFVGRGFHFLRNSAMVCEQKAKDRTRGSTLDVALRHGKICVRVLTQR